MGGVERFLHIASVLIAVFVILVGGLLSYLENKPLSSSDVISNTRMADNQEEYRAEFKAKNMSAFILGYTGEVGKELVKEVVKSGVFSRVVLIGRREIKYDDESLKDVEQKVIDFDKVEEHQDAFQDLQVGFCALGTTRGKAGKEGFIKVDKHYVVNSATVAKAAGCEDFHLVTSQGSNKDAFFLYPKTKGEAEEEVKAIGFDRFSIYRPAILMCDREESRPFERFARALCKPVQAAFPTAITTPTSVVAKAMVNCAASPRNETFKIFENKAIFQIAGALKK